MKEENLIFIVSQPRSGSTYLQNLLSNNEVTNTCSESWILLNFPNLLNPNLVQTKFDNKLASKAFAGYQNKFKDFDFSELQKKFLLDLYSPMSKGFEFVIDKTPRYWEILEEIHQLFPKSKIILLKRNPIEVAKSMIITWNLNTIPALANFKRDLIIAPKRILAFQEKYSNDPKIYALTYESLIGETFVEIKKLYEWLGIPFNAEVLKTDGNNKYKGEFGDPYQNSAKEYARIKEENKKKKLSSLHLKFLQGYSEFLGDQFLSDFGGYGTTGFEPQITLVFSHFLHHNEERIHSSFKSELKYLVKEGFFRLFG